VPEEVPPPTAHPGLTGDGFVLRDCTWISDGRLKKSQLLLPLSFSDEELDAHNERAFDQFRASEENRVRQELARAQLRLEEQEAAEEAADAAPAIPYPTSARVRFGKSQDSIGESERALLKAAELAAQPLLERRFEEILDDPNGHLYVPVYAWDEPLKLIERKSATPDRNVHKRGKDLFLQIGEGGTAQFRTVGYPLSQHGQVLRDLERIELELPHFAEVVHFVRDSVMLSYARQKPLRIAPILILGEPGIGKTHFTLELATALRVPMHRHAFDSGITETALLGSERRWSNTSTGLLFESVVLGFSASPVVLLDEIDKARKGDSCNPLAPLHGLLEPVSASTVTDISVDFTMDASHVVWIATGNEMQGIPSPIRSRFREFVIEPPMGEAAIQAAHAVARVVYDRMGHELFDPPSERMVVALAHLPARQQIQVWEMGYARALANGSRVVHWHHLPSSILHNEEDATALQDTGDSTPPSEGGYLH
jgi:ATP-dependent Lon protease